MVDSLRFQESKIGFQGLSKHERQRTFRQGILFGTQTAISMSERAHVSTGPGTPDTLTRLTEVRNPWPSCGEDPR